MTRRVEVDIDERGCWRPNIPPRADGRSMVFIDGRKRYLYREVYKSLVGGIGGGNHLHHTCENPWCVNPWHMEELSPRDHRGRHPHPDKDKRFCVRGHDTWLAGRTSSRVCRECQRLHNEKRSEKRRNRQLSTRGDTT